MFRELATPSSIPRAVKFSACMSYQTVALINDGDVTVSFEFPDKRRGGVDLVPVETLDEDDDCSVDWSAAGAFSLAAAAAANDSKKLESLGRARAKTQADLDAAETAWIAAEEALAEVA